MIGLAHFCSKGCPWVPYRTLPYLAPRSSRSTSISRTHPTLLHSTPLHSSSFQFGSRSERKVRSAGTTIQHSSILAFCCFLSRPAARSTTRAVMSVHTASVRYRAVEQRAPDTCNLTMGTLYIHTTNTRCFMASSTAKSLLIPTNSSILESSSSSRSGLLPSSKQSRAFIACPRSTLLESGAELYIIFVPKV